MEISKADLVRIIREELTRTRKRGLHVLKENTGGVHADKSPDAIARWYIGKWDKMRAEFAQAMSRPEGDRWVNQIAQDAIDQIKNEPEIAEEYYPHLTEVELNMLIRTLEEDVRLNTPR